MLKPEDQTKEYPVVFVAEFVTERHVFVSLPAMCKDALVYLLAAEWLGVRALILKFRLKTCPHCALVYLLAADF